MNMLELNTSKTYMESDFLISVAKLHVCALSEVNTARLREEDSKEG